MRKKIALCLALAMSLSMTACKATPTNSPSVETGESTTEKTYTAKNLSDEEFYKLRVLAPDGNTPENPERYGEWGHLMWLMSNPSDETLDYLEEVAIKENFAKYNTTRKSYPYTRHNHVAPRFDLVFSTNGHCWMPLEEFLNCENWDIYYNESESYTYVEEGKTIGGLSANEYVAQEYTENYKAFLKLHEKYDNMYLFSTSYWIEAEKRSYGFKDSDYVTPNQTDDDFFSYAENYGPAGITEYRAAWDQTYLPVQQNEYPKVLDIINRYLRAKYLGENEVYDKDFTKDFLATANFNPEVIKEYYNKNGAIFTDIKNVKITHSNFDCPIVPMTVEYTLCTEYGEYTVEDYMYITYTYDEKANDFNFKIAYTSNEETLVETIKEIYSEESLKEEGGVNYYLAGYFIAYDRFM